MPKTFSETALIDNDAYTVELYRPGLNEYQIAFDSNQIAEELYSTAFGDWPEIAEASYGDGELYIVCTEDTMRDFVEYMNEQYFQEVQHGTHED